MNVGVHIFLVKPPPCPRCARMSCIARFSSREPLTTAPRAMLAATATHPLPQRHACIKGRCSDFRARQRGTLPHVVMIVAADYAPTPLVMPVP